MSACLSGSRFRELRFKIRFIGAMPAVSRAEIQTKFDQLPELSLPWVFRSSRTLLSAASLFGRSLFAPENISRNGGRARRLRNLQFRIRRRRFRPGTADSGAGGRFLRSRSFFYGRPLPHCPENNHTHDSCGQPDIFTRRNADKRHLHLEWIDRGGYR